MQILKRIFFVFYVVCCSCDTFLCGVLDPELSGLIKKSELEYGDQFEIEAIPCEFYEINLKAKNDNIQDSVIKVLHYHLFDTTKDIGWRLLVVYDKNGNYLFNDPLDGPRYRK